VRRQFVDAETGAPVDEAAQVKGYEVAPDDYVMLEPAEIAAAVPHGDKTLTIERFVACADIDDVYFDRPYYLTPADASAVEAFTLIREGMRRRAVAALARAVLFRRVRTLLIRPYADGANGDGAGLLATTLRFDDEVRAAGTAFGAIPALEINPEMLDLARHIIATRRGEFDPAAFHDRYEAALAELVRARRDGRAPPSPPPSPRATGAGDLLAALRRSAGADPAEAGDSNAGDSNAGDSNAGEARAGRRAVARPAAKREPVTKTGPAPRPAPGSGPASAGRTGRARRTG
jgi:DNA end-binding protein Ku